MKAQALTARAHGLYHLILRRRRGKCPSAFEQGQLAMLREVAQQAGIPEAEMPPEIPTLTQITEIPF